MKTNNTISMKTCFIAAALVGAAFFTPACDDDDDAVPNADGGPDALGTGGVIGTGGAGGAGAKDASTDATGDAAPAVARGAANPPTLGVAIDRMGRPAIATALIGTFEADAAKKKTVKDLYNVAPMATWATFAPEIKKNLAILDSLDANCGNQLAADKTAGSRYSFLAGVLADDRLYVNAASGVCGTYLGVEAGLVGAVVPANCGGRTPNDDVIERSYSVLAAGALGGVDDTITKDADVTHNLTTFPWLAAPLP